MNSQTLIDNLNSIVMAEDMIEIGRKAVEDHAIDLRDSRIGMMGVGNGIVCRERDGTSSSIIRMRTDGAIRLALHAMIEHLETLKENNE